MFTAAYLANKEEIKKRLKKVLTNFCSFIQILKKKFSDISTLTADSLAFHDTIHWKRAKQVNLRCKATRLAGTIAGTTCGAEEVFIVHSSPASYYTGKNYRELGKYISGGNKNIPPDKMSGRSKVVSDKTEFLNFQPDKCPMSGAISRRDLLSYGV